MDRDEVNAVWEYLVAMEQRPCNQEYLRSCIAQNTVPLNEEKKS